MDISVLTQNCFFSKKIRKVKRLIKDNPSDVYCFQEITGKEVAEDLRSVAGTNFIISNSINTSNSFISSKFHNLIFSKFPIEEYGEINFERERERVKEILTNSRVKHCGL